MIDQIRKLCRSVLSRILAVGPTHRNKHKSRSKPLKRMEFTIERESVSVVVLGRCAECPQHAERTGEGPLRGFAKLPPDCTHTVIGDDADSASPVGIP